MFRCVCYTCDERRAYDEWADAQTAFNEHVSDRHEVVLERASPADGPPNPDSVEETTESGAAAKSVSDSPDATDG